MTAHVPAFQDMIVFTFLTISRTLHHVMYVPTVITCAPLAERVLWSPMCVFVCPSVGCPQDSRTRLWMSIKLGRSDKFAVDPIPDVDP